MAKRTETQKFVNSYVKDYYREIYEECNLMNAKVVVNT